MNIIEYYCTLLERESLMYQSVQPQQCVAIATTPNCMSICKIGRVGIGRPSMVNDPVFMVVADASAAYDVTLDGQVRQSRTEPVAQLHRLEYRMPGVTDQLGVLSKVRGRGFWIPVTDETVIKPVSEDELGVLARLLL